MIPKRLSTSESLMLDLVRVLASAVVAFAHLTQSPFSTGWRDLTDYGRDSVAVFFVLSGFVIRHVTTRHDSNLGNYLADRLSRIYSVAIPALVLTLVLDSISRHVNPAFYNNWSYQYPHPLWRIAINMAFCGQLWNHFVDPLSNSPYWSINYEVAYYFGYGVFLYLVGRWRWIAIVALSLFFGPRVLLLASLWIAGCVIHDLYQRWNTAGTTLSNLIRAAMSFVVISGGALAFRWVKHKLSGNMPVFRHAIYPDDQRLKPNNFIFGIAWMLVFLTLLYLASRLTLVPNSRFVRMSRFIAEGTFPIYLLHFPIYVLIAACVPYNHGSIVSKLLIFVVTITLGILAGRPCNILKAKLRLIAANLSGTNLFVQ